MSLQRGLPGWILGIAAAGLAGPALAEGTLRWPPGSTPLGLQLAAGESACAGLALTCADTARLRLYDSRDQSRSLSLEIGPEGVGPAGMAGASQGLRIGLLGQAAVDRELGLRLYGRMGSTHRRAGLGATEGGLTYGVGLSWDFSRRGTASLGWDSQELRGSPGEGREVRATRLGLQWRY